MNQLDYPKNSFWGKSVKFYVGLFIMLALCYGFTLTHFSVGIDDELFHMYFYEGGLVVQKRWFQPLLARCVKIFEFLPFWRDFFALVLSVAALHLIFNELNRVVNGAFDENAELMFIGLSLACSFLALRFIFAMTTVVAAIGLFVQSFIIRMLFQYTQKRTLKAAAWLLLALTLARSIGEDTIILCVTLGGFTLTLNLIYSEKGIEFKKVFCDVLVFFVSIVCAMVIYSVATDIVYKIFNIHSVAYVDNYGAFSLENILRVMVKLPVRLLSLSERHTIVITYFITLIILMVLGIVHGVKKKSATILIALVCCGISPFFIVFFTGNVYLPLRVFANFGIYIGLVFMLLYDQAKEWKHSLVIKDLTLDKIMFAFAIVTILVQSCEMNRIFFNDYLTYQRDVDRMESIYQDITEVCDGIPQKPVCFMGIPHEYALQDAGDAETRSIFTWDRTSVSEFLNHRIINFFNLHGYEISQLHAYDEVRLRKETAEMEVWPDEGSILDMGDYILVNLSKPVYGGAVEPEEWHEILEKKGNESKNTTAIDTFYVTDQSLLLNGWTFLEGCSSYNTEKTVYLVGEDLSYILNPNTVDRYDISQAYGVGNLYDAAGFSVNLNTTLLEKGNYQVLLKIENNGYYEIVDLNQTINIP